MGGHQSLDEHVYDPWRFSHRFVKVVVLFIYPPLGVASDDCVERHEVSAFVCAKLVWSLRVRNSYCFTVAFLKLLTSSFQLLGDPFLLSLITYGLFVSLSFQESICNLMSKSFALFALAALGCAAGESGDATLPVSRLCGSQNLLE